jgi:hypothetical protein
MESFCTPGEQFNPCPPNRNITELQIVRRPFLLIWTSEDSEEPSSQAPVSAFFKESQFEAVTVPGYGPSEQVFSNGLHWDSLVRVGSIGVVRSIGGMVYKIGQLGKS